MSRLNDLGSDLASQPRFRWRPAMRAVALPGNPSACGPLGCRSYRFGDGAEPQRWDGYAPDLTDWPTAGALLGLLPHGWVLGHGRLAVPMPDGAVASFPFDDDKPGEAPARALLALWRSA